MHPRGSQELRFHIDFTSSSLRFHSDVTLISIRVHFDFTSDSLRFHIDFTSSSLRFPEVFENVRESHELLWDKSLVVHLLSRQQTSTHVYQSPIMISCTSSKQARMYISSSSSSNDPPPLIDGDRSKQSNFRVLYVWLACLLDMAMCTCMKLSLALYHMWALARRQTSPDAKLHFFVSSLAQTEPSMVRAKRIPKPVSDTLSMNQASLAHLPTSSQLPHGDITLTSCLVLVLWLKYALAAASIVLPCRIFARDHRCPRVQIVATMSVSLNLVRAASSRLHGSL